jgi:hypothetical protein
MHRCRCVHAGNSLVAEAGASLSVLMRVRAWYAAGILKTGHLARRVRDTSWRSTDGHGLACPVWSAEAGALAGAGAGRAASWL